MDISRQIIIAALLVLAVVGLFVAVTGRLPFVKQSKRAGDRNRKLSKHDRLILKQAQDLFEKKNYKGASMLLERIGMHREAITILEKKKMIDEAAAVLIRMNNYNRAGVVYGRNNHYLKAAECFVKAGKNFDAASHFEKAQEYELALKHYQLANMEADQIRVLIELQRNIEAGQMLFRRGKVDRAFTEVMEGLSRVEDFSTIVISSELENTLIKKAIDSPLVTGFCEYLSYHKKLHELILPLVDEGRMNDVIKAYKVATYDMGPSLIQEVNYGSKQAESLAIVFEKVTNFHFAGLVWEKLKEFSRAGMNFEKAENLEKSLECFRSAGDSESVRRLEAKIKYPSLGKRQQQVVADYRPVGGMEDFDKTSQGPANPDQHFMISDLTAGGDKVTTKSVQAIIGDMQMTEHGVEDHEDTAQIDLSSVSSSDDDTVNLTADDAPQSFDELLLRDSPIFSSLSDKVLGVIAEKFERKSGEFDLREINQKVVISVVASDYPHAYVMNPWLVLPTLDAPNNLSEVSPPSDWLELDLKTWRECEQSFSEIVSALLAASFASQTQVYAQKTQSAS